MKTQKKQIHHHKKRTGHHQKRTKSFHNTYLPYLPMTIILFLSVFISGYSPRSGTLAYATEISRQNLLFATNAQRVSNSRGELTLNDQLNSAAQAKANDMVSRNYWSHNTPDGQEPWVFINGAGYSYIKAGENLAYGFLNSDATVEGWMNSPSHKDNLLDIDFSEVGFGFANSSNFNNAGEETVVVAMYGKPYVLATSSSTEQTKPSPVSISNPSNESNNNTPTENKLESAASQSQETKDKATPSVVVSASSIPVKQSQVIFGYSSPITVGVITFVTGFLLAVLLLRHGLRIKNLFKESASFITHHPLIDSTILALIILGITLLRTVGNIL